VLVLVEAIDLTKKATVRPLPVHTRDRTAVQIVNPLKNVLMREEKEPSLDLQDCKRAYFYIIIRSFLDVLNFLATRFVND